MDEVTTGIGRTGGWILSHELGVEPDLLALSKGLTGGYFPMGATIVSSAIATQLFDQGGIFLHGSTQCGHPIGCAAALAVLQLLEQNQLVESVRPKSDYVITTLKNSLDGHPNVGDIRGKGMIFAIEFVADRISKAAVDYEFGQRLSARLHDQGVLGKAYMTDGVGGV